MVELSVIIPTYNRMERLRACLEALAQQTQAPADYEVIVVVDGSTDNTRTMLAELSVPYELRVIEQANQGQQIARNQGVAASTGQYCLFLDDDIIAAPGLVAAHLSAQRQAEGLVAIGRITLTLPPDADWFLRAYAQAWENHYTELNSGQRSPIWEDCYGGNVSVAREDFLAVGGFAPDIRRSHDIEFGYRLQQHGLKFVYLADAAGAQDERKSAVDLAEDARKAGSAWLKLCQRHPDMMPILLGPLLDASLYERIVRNVLWLLRITPVLLVWLGALAARLRRRYKVYRFLHKYFYWRGVRQAAAEKGTWNYLTQGVSVLMYHAFAGSGETASRYVMPAPVFERQLTVLKWLGYQVISLETFLEHRATGRLLPPRAVIITIDDGYRDNHTHAYPILRRQDMPASLFLVSDRIGGSNDWSQDAHLKGRSLLDWPDIQTMQEAGLTCGAHTRTHPDLTALPPEQATTEIEGSRLDLESRLQTSVNTLAYPYGAYDEAAQEMARAAGFQAALTVDPGRNTIVTPVYALRRVEIWGTDSLLRFLLAVWFGDAEALRPRRPEKTPVSEQLSERRKVL